MEHIDAPAFLTERDQAEAMDGQFTGAASMVMVLDVRGRVLLNLRDDKPSILYPNHWAILGGASEPGETPEMTARRELREEIGLEAGTLDAFCRVIDRGGHRHLVSVFVTRTDIALSDLRLSEGQALRFFDIEELDALLVTPFVREVLNAYATLDEGKQWALPR